MIRSGAPRRVERPPSDPWRRVAPSGGGAVQGVMLTSASPSELMLSRSPCSAPDPRRADQLGVAIARLESHWLKGSCISGLSSPSTTIL